MRMSNDVKELCQFHVAEVQSNEVMYFGAFLLF